ncbi:hypothetical protein H072_454 [Dactylellina haptotyla CBS 200.50]|uniref:Uncharacterized protein n=1 Tax=Dactylellina haptotyla (strain CBS 200.50) TaxID=1284197 RepID=S8ARC0_DACHA|nr:hypothetical protein H072_454 [Dactylellina haptotyla CBS 200.50]
MYRFVVIWFYISYLSLIEAYLLTFNLRHLARAGDPALTLSASSDGSIDSIEKIFGINSSGTSPYDRVAGENDGVVKLQENSPSLNPLTGIAGRITIPSKSLYHPIADYAGHTGSVRRLSQTLADASGIELLHSASQQSPISQALPDNTEITVGDRIPPFSIGRCFDFVAPEDGLLLSSMKFSGFGMFEDRPIGIYLFSAEGCDSGKGFIGYQDVDFEELENNYEIDLRDLAQPVRQIFSALPVYTTPHGDTTDLYTDEEIARNIGRRPGALNFLKTPDQIDIGRDGSLLGGEENSDYRNEFDVPWRDLQEAEGIERIAPGAGEEFEETKGTPTGRNLDFRHNFYLNPVLRRNHGVPPASRSVGDSPHRLPFALADSESESEGIEARILDEVYDRDEHDTIPGDDYMAWEIEEGEDDYDEPTQFDRSTWMLPPLWQINTEPQYADLEPSQFPENRGLASSEEKGR